MTSSEEAKKSNVQPRRPCHDCPWRRAAIPGWLGNQTVEGWRKLAHGEARIDCHVVEGNPQPQCAGAAIYRANVGKLVQDPRTIRREADRDAVFASPMEFKAHHEGGFK